jgi:hypothetical protein
MKTMTKPESKVKKTSTGNSKETRPTGKKSNFNDDIIRKKAYEIYLERGASAGNAYDDWKRAEKELRHSNG